MIIVVQRYYIFLFQFKIWRNQKKVYLFILKLELKKNNKIIVIAYKYTQDIFLLTLLILLKRVAVVNNRVCITTVRPIRGQCCEIVYLSGT